MYKLINTLTNEEYLCEKITINGFDYYVILDEGVVGDFILFCGKISKKLFKNQWSIDERKVIATNNPNIDLPYIISEVEYLADNYVFNENGHKFSNNNNEAGDNFKSFKDGFKKAKESYQFTHDDMIEFAKWLRTEDTEKNAEKYANFYDLDMLNFWTNNQIKILYYEQ